VTFFFEDTMPNIKSAKKRMELSRVANARNRAFRSRIRTAIRRVREAEDVETAQTCLREAVALLDRAATRRLIHPNRTARLKGQLARRVNEISAAS
jgi:small subunit ribosomal protein S20